MPPLLVSFGLLPALIFAMVVAVIAELQFLCLAEGRVSLAGRLGEHGRGAISAAYFGT